MPTTVFFDPDGKIFSRATGSLDRERLTITILDLWGFSRCVLLIQLL